MEDKVDEVAVGQIQLHSSDHGTEDVFLSHLIYQKKYQEEEKEKSWWKGASAVVGQIGQHSSDHKRGARGGKEGEEGRSRGKTRRKKQDKEEKEKKEAWKELESEEKEEHPKEEENGGLDEKVQLLDKLTTEDEEQDK